MNYLGQPQIGIPVALVCLIGGFLLAKTFRVVWRLLTGIVLILIGFAVVYGLLQRPLGLPDLAKFLAAGFVFS